MGGGGRREEPDIIACTVHAKCLEHTWITPILGTNNAVGKCFLVVSTKKWRVSQAEFIITHIQAWRVGVGVGCQLLELPSSYATGNCQWLTVVHDCWNTVCQNVSADYTYSTYIVLYSFVTTSFAHHSNTSPRRMSSMLHRVVPWYLTLSHMSLTTSSSSWERYNIICWPLAATGWVWVIIGQPNDERGS